MKVLILGVTGMLGYSLFKNLMEYSEYEVYGTARNLSGKQSFFKKNLSHLILNIDAFDSKAVENAISSQTPEIVINCIGLIKQHSMSKQHVDAVKVNSLLPHELATLCEKYQAKLLHFSTDCVFDGSRGGYKENDFPTARDLYGRSKCLGEVDYEPHLTLRTSIIGHELSSNISLVDWFLSQTGSVKGFSRAIFSGLPTCVIAKILAEKILPEKNLVGLYHLSVDPIDKCSLLKLIAEAYGKSTDIYESQELVIDRSLDSSLLRNKLDLHVSTWKELVSKMHTDYLKNIRPNV